MSSDHKIRVLYVMETFGSGGVEKRRISLAKGLPKEHYEVRLACTKTVGEAYKELEANGVLVTRLGKLHKTYTLRPYLRLLNLVREFRPHIIHGAVFEGVTLASIVGYFCRVPVRIIEETSDPVTRSSAANTLMKFFSSLSHTVVGVSPASYNYLKETLGLGDKARLINNGVALPRKVSHEEVIHLKSLHGIPPGSLVIGAVGRMNSDANKRFSDLIIAFSELEISEPVVLIMVGEGQEKQSYINLAKDLGVDDRVYLLGYQSDTALYYKCMDLFCIPSAHEAFGLVVPEAMLAGLAVVGTRVGGIAYIIKDKETGYLVDAKNPEALKQGLSKLLSDKKLREEFGMAGKKRALANYTESIYLKNVKKLYQEWVDKKISNKHAS